MDSRVKIEMQDTDDGIATFNRDNIIALCRKVLKKYPDWEFIVERELEMGKHLELAWRMETKLDWVWLDDDVDGKTREWAVLCGLALKQVFAPTHISTKWVLTSSFVHVDSPESHPAWRFVWVNISFQPSISKTAESCTNRPRSKVI
jgi:hypothetical protein